MKTTDLFKSNKTLSFITGIEKDTLMVIYIYHLLKIQAVYAYPNKQEY